MSKNPIFQETKKIVKKPYFSGERKKMSKTPTKKKFQKIFTAKFIVKKNSKNFGHFLVVKIMSFSLEKV